MKAVYQLLFISILYSTVVISQSEDRPNSNKTIIEILKEKVNPGETRSIRFQTFETSLTIVNYVKDELIASYATSISDVYFDQNEHIFSFNYNENLDKETLISLLKKNEMFYLLEQKEILK
jgi:hypothetical protein